VTSFYKNKKRFSWRKKELLVF